MNTSDKSSVPELLPERTDEGLRTISSGLYRYGGCYGEWMHWAAREILKLRAAAQREILKQIWFCEGCGVLGVVVVEGERDVVMVYHAIGAAHQTSSPACQRGVAQLRVICLDNVTETSELGRHKEPSR
jgi:hypothetical protein